MCEIFALAMSHDAQRLPRLERQLAELRGEADVVGSSRINLFTNWVEFLNLHVPSRRQTGDHFGAIRSGNYVPVFARGAFT